MANLRSLLLWTSALFATTHAHSCQVKHTIKPGDTCLGILAQYDHALSLKDFYDANPSVDALCHNLQPGSQVCVLMHGYEGCLRTILVEAGSTCKRVAKTAGISLKDFYRLNPEVNKPACDNLYTGQRYCIKDGRSVENTHYGGPNRLDRPHGSGASRPHQGSESGHRPPFQPTTPTTEGEEDCDEVVSESSHQQPPSPPPAAVQPDPEQDCEEESTSPSVGAPSSSLPAPSSIGSVAASQSSEPTLSSEAAASSTHASSSLAIASSAPSGSSDPTLSPSSSIEPSSGSAGPTSAPSSEAETSSAAPSVSSSTVSCASDSYIVCPPMYSDTALKRADLAAALTCFYEERIAIASGQTITKYRSCAYDTATGALNQASASPDCDTLAVGSCKPVVSSATASSTVSASAASSTISSSGPTLAPSASIEPSLGPSSAPSSSAEPSSSAPAPSSSAVSCATDSYITCPPAYGSIPLKRTDLAAELMCRYESREDIGDGFILIRTSICQYDTTTGVINTARSSTACDRIAIGSCKPIAVSASASTESASSSAPTSSSPPSSSVEPSPSSTPSSSAPPAASSSAAADVGVRAVQPGRRFLRCPASLPSIGGSVGTFQRADVRPDSLNLNCAYTNPLNIECQYGIDGNSVSFKPQCSAAGTTARLTSDTPDSRFTRCPSFSSTGGALTGTPWILRNLTPLAIIDCRYPGNTFSGCRFSILDGMPQPYNPALCPARAIEATNADEFLDSRPVA